MINIVEEYAKTVILQDNYEWKVKKLSFDLYEEAEYFI